MSGRIHFVRHAETLFNVNGQLQGWCDSPLTDRGERQAAALGERMRGLPLAAAFMSDLTRTRTTMAAALIGHPRLEPTPMVELREWNFGSWEGQPNASLWVPVFAEHGLAYSHVTNNWPAMTENGFDGVIDSIHRNDPLGRADSAAEVNARVATAIQAVVSAADLATRQDDGDVLVVTHGAVLGSLLHHLAPESTPRAGFPNCGIVSVTWRDGQPTLSDVDGSCALLGEQA